MKVTVKKLYHNFASIRDYKVAECVKKGEDLVIVYNMEKMTVELKDLKNPFNLHEKEMVSKFDGKIYKLIDFKFIADGHEWVLKREKKEEDKQQKLF